MTDRSQTAYERASYLSKLKETETIVLTDLDGTMTSGEECPSQKELDDRRNVRKLLENKGVVTGAVTARTVSLTLSSTAYQASETLRTIEYAPRWGVDKVTGKRISVPLEEVPFFDSCLDFDFTASFGSAIAIKNGQGYMVDMPYYDLLRYDYDRSHTPGGVDREPWRHAMREFIFYELSEFTKYMSPLERTTNYRGGLTDSAPLHFRYQFNFIGREGLEAMMRLKTVIDVARQKVGSDRYDVALRIKMVDESKPDLKDPEKSKYTLYLIPWGGTKEKMIHRVFSHSVKAAGSEVKDIRLFYAGDTLTDLRAGLYAGGDAKFIFLLATGSRLAPYILEKMDKFGDEDLSFLWPNADHKDGPHEFESRLVSTNEKGVYQFVHKIRKDRVNTVIIGDERYPGLTPPGSVHAFLDEFL
jgi:hypothetical protein